MAITDRAQMLCKCVGLSQLGLTDVKEAITGALNTVDKVNLCHTWRGLFSGGVMTVRGDLTKHNIC